MQVPRLGLFEILILMVETEVVRDFLARHQSPPLRLVVGRRIEVRVIQLRRRLGDVLAIDQICAMPSHPYCHSARCRPPVRPAVGLH
jgi:hypothetical protein